MNKRGIVYIAAALAFLMFVSGFIYCIPIDISTETAVISSDGKTEVPVALDITLQKHIFRPTDVYGSIVFNGLLYVDSASLGHKWKTNDSFIELLKAKLNGRLNYSQFVRYDHKGQPALILGDTLLMYRQPDGSYFMWHTHEGGVDEYTFADGF